MTFELAQQLSRIWLGNPGELHRTRWKEEWFKEGVATYLAYYLLAQVSKLCEECMKKQSNFIISLEDIDAERDCYGFDPHSGNAYSEMYYYTINTEYSVKLK